MLLKNQTEQGYARTEQASSPMVAAAFERLGFSVFDLDDLRSGELEQMERCSNLVAGV